MDHDAMLRHVNKLKTFRDDFLTMSGVTAEEFHEMAERVRAGESPEAVARSVRKLDEDEFEATAKSDSLGGTKDDGTGVDPAASKEAAGEGQAAQGTDGAADPNKTTSDGVKAS